MAGEGVPFYRTRRVTGYLTGDARLLHHSKLAYNKELYMVVHEDIFNMAGDELAEKLDPATRTDLQREFYEMMQSKYVGGYTVGVEPSGECQVVINGGEEIFIRTNTINRSFVVEEKRDGNHCLVRLKFHVTDRQEFKAAMCHKAITAKSKDCLL